MARFAYQAKKKDGAVAQGEVEAFNEMEARTKLRLQQLEVVRIVSFTPKRSTSSKSTGTGFFSPKVNSKDLQVFTRQFSTLINSGIPVVDSLKILSEGLRPGLLKEVSAQVKISIEQGKRLAESMASHPAVFDKLFVNMIQAGEEAGILDTILSRLASYIEKSEKIKSQVKGAMVYPAVILAVASLVIFAILFFVIPKFKEFYSSSGGELPALTQNVVNLSESLQNEWYIYLGSLISFYLALSWFISNPDNQKIIDRILIRIPVIGELIQKSAIARLSRTLSTLLASGVGIIEALEIAARTSGNTLVEEAMLRCKDAVINGKKLSEPLKKETIIPDMVRQMIAIGDESGSTDTMLGKIADFYEDEVETAVKAMTSLIEPLMMVFLGGVIAVLVLAMYLPVFNMADVIGK